MLGLYFVENSGLFAMKIFATLREVNITSKKGYSIIRDCSSIGVVRVNQYFHRIN